MDKSKGKLEPTRTNWDLHLSSITSSFHALGALQETRATFTSKLHMHLARDAQKQRTWRELPQTESRSVILTIGVGRTAAVSLLPSKPQAECLS